MKWQTAKKWRQWPENWAHQLESFSPLLAKRVLNYASQAVQPELLGTFFHLKEWTDTRVGVSLSGRSATAGNLVTLSEFMVRKLLGRHLALNSENIGVKSVEAHLDTAFHHRLHLRLEIPKEVREDWIRQAYQKGSSSLILTVHLLSDLDMRVGEVGLEIELHPKPALPAATESDRL